MRCGALGLLVLGGCNFVFGLDATKLAPDAAVLLPRVPYHIALRQLTMGANLTPNPPADVAMPDLVLLEARTLDGAQSETLTPDADGRFDVAGEIAAVPWRLVYQRQGGVVHEIQSPPPEAHLAEALFGPVVRTPPGVGVGYSIQPTNGPANHGLNNVYTTGVWTEGSVALPPGGPNLDYDFSLHASPMSGAIGVPDATDRAMLIDSSVVSSCRTSTGAMEFAAAPLAPDPFQTVTGPWYAVATQPLISTDTATVLDPGDFEQLGEQPVQPNAVHERFGYLPSAEMPAFTRAATPTAGVLLVNPVMIAVRSCPLPYPSGAPTLVEPSSFQQHLARTVHTELGTSRSLRPGGPTLINGAAYVTSDPGLTNPFVTARSIATAKDVKIAPAGGAAIDLFGTDEAQRLPSRDGTFTVTWAKQPANGKADFWEVSLLEVSGSMLLERRVYLATGTSFAISGADLTADTEYVLRFTAFTGRASAASGGDFRLVTGDQAITVVHARSFATP